MKVGTYTKADFLMVYGVKMPVFERWIVDIMDEIGWIKGKQQKFPPRMVKVIFDYLGEPE